MSRDAGENSGSVGSQSSGGGSGGGVSVDSGTRSIPAPRWLGKRVGRFKLTALLGQGAMGRVFRAEDTLMGRHVALKVLPKSLKKGSVRLQPEVLINEARAAAAIEHPNAVQIYEVNQAGDVCYVAMELLEGGSLRDLVRAAGPMDIPRACLLCAEAAEALAAGHAVGVIHRDVKPANLMLSRQGRCKVVDFGLARLEGPGDASAVTESVGTPQFIAPEILSGTPASAQSDVYSLAGTLWYLLTGSAPYQGKNAQELLRMHMESPVPDLRSVRPEAPAAVAEALETALSKRPAERFATMEQFARVLRVHAIAVPSSADSAPFPPPRPAAPSNGNSRHPATPLDSASRAARQTPLQQESAPRSQGIGWMAFAGAAILIVIIVAVICIILMHPSGTSSVSQSAPPVTPNPASPPAVAPAVSNPEAPPAPSSPSHAVQPAPAPVIAVPIGDFESDRDIGDVGDPGSAKYDAVQKRYMVTSSGKDIFGRADAFHFVWKKISGNVTIKAKIAILGDKKDPSQKGVLMIRQSLDPGSVFVDAALHANGLVALQARPQADGVSTRKLSTVNGSTLWLERHGNEFNLYVADSEDKPVQAATLNVPMSDPIYVGLGVSSHDVKKQISAVFSDVDIKSGAEAGAP